MGRHTDVFERVERGWFALSEWPQALKTVFRREAIQK
jgi:hypothetical protein